MADIRTPNKSLYKRIRMQLVGKHAKTDCKIDETTSWPDGLHESSRFSPFLRRPVRRTDSADDIQRYKDYFSIARKNQGEHFTWRRYCDILLADLLSTDVIVSLNKMSIQYSAPVRSHESKCATRSVSSISEFENHKPQKRSYLDINADVQSVSSLDDVKFIHTPSKNVLKKMCTEIRSLAQRTCRTVEKMTTTKYCTGCGDVIRGTTVHKKCSKQRLLKTDYNRPITPGILKSADLARKRPLCFQSPSIKTSYGTSVFEDNLRSKKLRGKATIKTIIKEEK